FSYPLQLSYTTLRQLGPVRTTRIVCSYVKARLFPIRQEKSLTDFIVNRFGRQLYLLFFKDYTEKVWGKPCDDISPEWGAQRIKGISLSKAISHAAQKVISSRKRGSDIAQKDTETSLIERFLYPKFGPGQLWEEVARQIVDMGGQIIMHHRVTAVTTADMRLTSISAVDTQTGNTATFEGEYFFSTMPVQELIAGMGSGVPENVRSVAAGLEYRDFITVGVLLSKMSPGHKHVTNSANLLPDTWIYIQEKDVRVGRLQIFNNWSPYLVKDPNTIWVGMEYFCNTEDDFWKQADENIKQLAVEELEKIGLATAGDVIDTTVLRMEKTYPAYFGTYDRFEELRNYIDRFENLFLIGRNGMHKYNNSDHSMLTAMVAVDNICNNITGKSNIWSINTEQEYHEEKETAGGND
ncbi:MAG TPA: NAD(P)/FAD-dependent oxidoreductase, partial [Puia sp.]|nr:NAD(P)/FAD-dependent oxidoreductase [Puia sp.]